MRWEWGQPCAGMLVALMFTASFGGVSCSAATANPQAEELKAAINAKYKPSLTSWDESILNDTMSNLKLERILWSSKPRRFEFTVFTQLTIDRLPTLFNMCSSFSGPLSAAVVESTHGICQLDLMLFYELFNSKQSQLLYPVNYLRNYARMQVRTRLMAMIDVDMYISRSLSVEMAKRENIQRYEEHCAERRATVLPAFEPTKIGTPGRAMATKLCGVSKAELQEMHGQSNQVIQFKLRTFPRGHTPTNYTRWFEETEPYEVSYKRSYEPWFITCNEIMPWYDVEFRGYGMNKIVLVAALPYYNYTFWIHPSAWIVHNPHDDTDVRRMVSKEAADVTRNNAKLPANALYNKVTGLFGKAKHGMMRGTYEPVVDPRMIAVYGKVTWLQPPPKMNGTAVPESMFV